MPVVTFSIPNSRGDLYERLRKSQARYKHPLSWVVCEALEAFFEEDNREIPNRLLTTQDKILEVLARLRGATTKEIADDLGKTTNIIRTELARMNKKGIVGKPGKTHLSKWYLLEPGSTIAEKTTLAVE